MAEAKGNWIDELSLALWAYRSIHKSTTGHSPFALAYGSEAMIPVEPKVRSHRRRHFNQRENKQLLLESLDQINEKREEAKLRIVAL